MIRFLDIFFSLTALLFLSPLFIPIIIILKFTGEGEIFYSQERIGKKGLKFKLHKFATMIKDSPNKGTGTVTIKNDPRILPFGKFLRKTKINELPQLFNVLFGDMSLIGPRPLTDQTFQAYPYQIQNTVVKVKPGLSGIGSIIFRAEEEIMDGNRASVQYYSDVIAPYKGLLEEWYVEKNSIYVYFLAIFVTVITVMFPSSSIAWRVFKNLPEPPNELRKALNCEN